MFEKNKKRLIKVFVVITVFTLLLIVMKKDATNLEVHFLAIGQGDAIFLQYKKFQILIDGGPDNLVLEKLREVMPIGDNHIDWVILSHPDADHLMGLVDILQSYSVDRVFMPKVQKETKLYQAWQKTLEEKQIETMYVQNAFVEHHGQLDIHFLHPTPETIEKNFAANNYSLITKISLGQIDILLTGDIEEEVEELFVKAYADLDIEVLKSPHHGSKSSSTPAFLSATKPEVIVVQVGEGNKFGHPHERVLYRYEKTGASILRTDQEGTISLATDGQFLWRSIPRLPIFPQLVGFNKESLYNGGI